MADFREVVMSYTKAVGKAHASFSSSADGKEVIEKCMAPIMAVNMLMDDWQSLR